MPCGIDCCHSYAEAFAVSRSILTQVSWKTLPCRFKGEGYKAYQIKIGLKKSEMKSFC